MHANAWRFFLPVGSLPKPGRPCGHRDCLALPLFRSRDVSQTEPVIEATQRELPNNPGTSL